MTGVLIDEHQTFPFDSPLFNPIYSSSSASSSPPFSRSEEPRRVSSPLRSFPSDLNVDDITLTSSYHRSNNHQSPMSGGPGGGGGSPYNCMDYFGSPPSEKSRLLNCDGGKEEFGPKVFCRSLSKLGLMPVSEELVLEGGYEGEGDGHAAGGYMDMKEMGVGGISIPMASVYSSNPCGGGGGVYSNQCGGSMGSPVLTDAISALQKFLPSNNDDEVPSWLTESCPEGVDFYSCDEFRMYEFKVRRCMRGRSHDWTECPFAHPGEKARRRDPRRFHYSGTACPDFRKGSCRRGDACEYAHGVFECWLHPARYRTQLCKDGKNCRRRVCFFAHTTAQLRLLPGSAQSANSCSRASLQSPTLKASLSGSYDGSPLRQALAGSLDSVLGFEGLGHNGLYEGSFDGGSRNTHLSLMGKYALGGFCGGSQISSPTSTLVGHSHSPPPLSPPLSPSESPPMSPNSPSSWTNALARRFSCLPGAQVPLQQTSLDAQVAISQIQASIAACTQNNGSLTAGTHGPSPLSSNMPAHRRHLDRLNSMPTISVPHMEGIDDNGSPKELQSTQAMNHLIATLQQLEFRRAAEVNRMSNQWSPRSHTVHFSRSVPGTPTNSRWAGQVESWDVGEAGEPLQRVESGRDLRAKIYGRLGKENPLENESPDLGWVNELVK